jgi:hypothetical protein
MAYETGSSTGHVDLLDKLNTFLAGTGNWTVIRDDGGPNNDQLLVTDDVAGEDNVFAFKAFGTGSVASWFCQPGTTDAGDAVEYDEHTGSPDKTTGGASHIIFGQRNGAVVQGFEGVSTAYHFFEGSHADGAFCHVVLQGEPGRFWHLSFGTIVKSGSFVGGQYMTASATGDGNNDYKWIFDNGFDAGNNTGCLWLRDDENWPGNAASTDGDISGWFKSMSQAGTESSDDENWLLPLFAGGLQDWNQRSPMCPVWCNIYNTSGAVNYATDDTVLVGHVPDVKFISLEGRYDSEELVVGSDTWIIFPMHRRTVPATPNEVAYQCLFTPGGAPNYESALMGLAYKKVV